MRVGGLLVFLAACGRIGFNAVAEDVDAATTDGRTPAACPITYRTIGTLPGRYSELRGSVSWPEASASCQADGTRLFVPDSAAEADGVHDAVFGTDPSLVGPILWIGITDLATEGTFLTEAGEVPPYLPWDPLEPNDNGGEDCVELGASTINDNKCDLIAWPFVCECP
jgi:hypothetical protein